MNLFEINLAEDADGPTGLIDPDMDALHGCCRDGTLPVVTDRSVWRQHLDPDGMSMADLSVHAVIRRQHGPSCASAAIVGAAETRWRGAGIMVPQLSIGAVFAFVGSRAGSSVQANFRRIQEVGTVPAELWPDDVIYRQLRITNFAEIASQYRMLEADWVPTFDAATWYLLCGHPIVFGVQWGTAGGHAIYAVRVVFDGRRWGWVIANSWGTGWGDRGYGVLWEPQIRTGIERRYGAAALRAPTYVSSDQQGLAVWPYSRRGILPRANERAREMVNDGSRRPTIRQIGQARVAARRTTAEWIDANPRQPGETLAAYRRRARQEITDAWTAEHQDGSIWLTLLLQFLPIFIEWFTNRR